MFTGIITDIGTVTHIERKGDTYIWIQTGLDLAQETIGASIACSGACLTVVEKKDDQFLTVASDETLDKTTLKFWAEGTKINLEPALRVGDSLGGHFVSGHVDGLAEVVSVEEIGESRKVTLRPPADLMVFIAAKGSITLDGVSLTVNEVGPDNFTINLIPHTWTNTTLHNCRPGALLNCEVDLIARYLLRQR